MVISNVMSIFNSPRLPNLVRNKLKEPDADLVIGNNIYEIKSYDVLKSIKNKLSS